MKWPQWVGIIFVAVLSAGLVKLFRHRAGAAGRRFCGHPLAAFGLGLLIFLALVALLAPLLAPFRPSLQIDILGMANQPPTWLHPMGTDLYSRDILSRMLYGARVSLGIGTLAMLVAVTIGGLVGAVAGLFGRGVDATLMRLVDIGLAVPRIFMVLVAIALWEQLSTLSLVLVLGLSGWFGTSRLVRAEVLVLRTTPFVDAARAIGASQWRVIFRHLLPNAAAPLIVSAALGIGHVILLEAALSYLGVGVQPPIASWGNMIADGRDQLTTAPWSTLFPGLAIALVVLSLNAVGDGLRDGLDPRTEI